MIYFASPYQTNPFNHNPLRDLLAEAINFEQPCASKPKSSCFCAPPMFKLLK